MNVRHPACASIAGLVLAAGCLLAPVGPAHAGTWCNGTTFQDFDNDDHADLVVARTLPATGAGVVDLHLSGGTTQTISAASLGHTSAPNDQFGASISIASMDESDNCPDLLIGAPGAAGGGAAYLVRGNGTGVADTAVTFNSPAAGARFGTTVAAADLSFTRIRVLVGAPGLSAGSAAEAGAVLVWQLEDGEPSGSPVTLDYTDFGGTPAAGDHLGAVLEADSWQVVLGVPDRDVGTAADAGEVVMFDFLDETGPITVRDWARANQDSPSAPGVAEVGDHFGAGVDIGGAFVFAGAPDEDIAGRADAGMVARFADADNHAVGSWKAWDQSTSGVPGTGEKGDRFGAAIKVGWVETLIDDDPFPMLVWVVGAPGEDIGTVKDAGAITVLAPGVKPAYGLSQGAGLPGKAEQGDQVGAALGDLPGEYRGTYHDGSGILVGAPGEDVGTTVDSGLVMSTRGLLPKGRHAWTSTTNAGAIVAGARYGWTLPSAS